MTSKLSAKFLEIFKNIKSDAVPRPPRDSESSPGPRFPHSETANENLDESNNQEDVFVEQEEVKKKKKPKFKKFFSAPSGESHDIGEDEQRNCDANSNINTQASGNVINIINSSRVHCGNEIVYYMGPVQNQQHQAKTSTSDDDDEEVVEKTNLIALLLEMDKQPEHEHIDYISKHLGKKWHSFFRKLGYKQGQIETAEIDTAKHGVAEARYKLLLDWIRNDDDGTLGKLAKVLWEDGERQIVKELAAMYNKNN